MQTKTCTKCGQELLATTEYFFKAKTCKDGLRTECKTCYRKCHKQYRDSNKEIIKQRGIQYYEINKEKINERHNQYNKLNKEQLKKYYEINKDKINKRNYLYWKNNKKKILEQKKEYYESNKEQISEKYKKYYKINLDKIREYNKKYCETNRNKFNFSVQKRRAKKKQLTNNYLISEWNACLDFFENKCSYCGKESNNLSQDHFVPLSKGGEYTKNNIIPACKSCNSSKKDRDFFIWYPLQPFYSKQREQKILQYLNYDSKAKIQQLALSI